MKRKGRRNKMEIYYDIMNSIHEEIIKNVNRITLTSIQYKSNLSYDKFIRFLDDLQRYKMIENTGKSFIITEKGIRYLLEGRKVKELFKKMELELHYEKH
ncbi:MAG: transcriptional regulator [Thaumarchaeota archaeon]|nr:transcriptional regulator [Nitrososphaerota archaeon]MBI3642106.1 transcriptional regulator [Nitrososphaerota archaeon]